MKARFIREAEVTHPQHKSQADVVAWRAKLDRGELTPAEWRAGMYLTVAPGVVVDHPHAHMLVKMGMAEPHDAECHAACKGHDIDAAAEGQDRLLLAQLTGDPRFDRADKSDTDDTDDTEEPEAKIVLTTPAEPPAPAKATVPAQPAEEAK